jgi:16S rRNA C1402 N4-methylase RsmH
MVKRFLREESGYFDRIFSRYDPAAIEGKDGKKFSFSLPKSSSIKPTQEELSENIRSRSARLRVAIKN